MDSPSPNLYQGLCDSHTHLLEMKKKGIDLHELLKELQEKQMGWVLDAGVDELHFVERLSYSDIYSKLCYAAGIHPNACNNLDEQLTAVEDQLQHPKVLAVGEIGLDYYWKDVPKKTQMDFLEAHFDLARKYHLPVIIHNREADEDILTCLKEARLPNSVVMHCYSSDWEMAKKFLDLNFYISFAGNVSYKKSLSIQETALNLPLNRILLETDAPYLAAQAVRGKKNRPTYTVYTLIYLAELRKMDPLKLKDATSQNFQTLFQPQSNV